MTDQETRLSLVEQSYQHLDRRLTSVESKIDEMRDDIKNGNQQMVKVLVGSAGTIVAGLLSTIVVILLNS